ncbi:MAG: protein kinase, partial [Myxococcales bacterium]|nr:protein kinase [Myxococcales bacterium]
MGSGGMGSVYRARDEQTGGPAALKLIAAETGDLRRFDREADLLAELDHPAIVRHLAHGRLADGRRFLAMQWLEGPSLRERLTQGPLSIEETLELGRRLASALEGVHAKGAIHRDIKPGNLMLVSA